MACGHKNCSCGGSVTKKKSNRLHKAKAFVKRCVKKLRGSVSTLEAHRVCGRLAKKRRVRKARRRARR